MDGGRCKSQRKYSLEEMAEDLLDYEKVEDFDKLCKFDRIKYIRKDTGEYRKGGLLLSGSREKNYLLIESFSLDWRTCKKLRFIVPLDKVVVFRLKTKKSKKKCEGIFVDKKNDNK